MKTLLLKSQGALMLAVALLFAFNSYSQGWKPELEKDAKEALATMISDAPKLQTFKEGNPLALLRSSKDHLVCRPEVNSIVKSSSLRPRRPLKNLRMET